MRRFFHEALPEQGEVVLEEEEAHHALHVLRLKPGDEIELFDGEGGAARAEVVAAKREVRVRIVERLVQEREPAVQVTLAFAPPRPKRTLALVEKATELGVAAFRPLVTARTRVALPEKAFPKLRRRAVEAAKQCRRNRVPRFLPSATIEELSRDSSSELRLLPDTRNARPLREVLRGGAARSVVFAVGPEGGFDDDERELLAKTFQPVTLGSTVLRVETAALAVLACLVYELG